jgi:hypothetical protein
MRKPKLPAMQHCIGDPHPLGDQVLPEPELKEMAWRDAVAGEAGIAPLLQRSHELRKLQLDLRRDIPQEAWQSQNMVTWLGLASAEFAVAKTVQHSLEHANELVKNALYREKALKWLDRQVVSGRSVPCRRTSMKALPSS